MGTRNRYEGIERYAVQLIKFKAMQMVGKSGFGEDDREDLEQELAADLLKRLPKFNPVRAQLNTFINRIVNHRVSTLIEAQKAKQRNFRLRGGSLNEVVDQGTNGIVERIDEVDTDEYSMWAGKSARTVEELMEMAIDINGFLADLPPNLRELCERLKTENVTDISRDTGIPRGTIYESITKLKGMFERAGMRDYL